MPPEKKHWTELERLRYEKTRYIRLAKLYKCKARRVNWKIGYEKERLENAKKALKKQEAKN